MHRLQGSCHCGALKSELLTERAPEQLKVRACACSFCRAHATACISDPSGRARLYQTKAGALVRYRFGLQTADFCLCGVCGVYMGAVVQSEGTFATLNARVFERFAEFSEAESVDYGDESLQERLQRRRLRWTPATVEA